MHWFKIFLTKPVTVTIALLAALPVTPVILCVLYGWTES